jgi:hypothetical protein
MGETAAYYRKHVSRQTDCRPASDRLDTHSDTHSDEGAEFAMHWAGGLQEISLQSVGKRNPLAYRVFGLLVIGLIGHWAYWALGIGHWAHRALGSPCFGREFPLQDTLFDFQDFC